MHRSASVGRSLTWRQPGPAGFLLMQCVVGSSCPAKIGGAAYFKAFKKELRSLCRNQHRKLSGASCRASCIQHFKTKTSGAGVVRARPPHKKAEKFVSKNKD